MRIIDWRWYRGGTFVICSACEYKNRKASKVARHWRREHAFRLA